ncbi:MAG: P-II family nitrogen regulator [Capsulimonas sp.]|uniref:P-II family nitrogen regulator n=1 Tax=Capsulimonas sp. TaxID=2494211 RepID=UPI0032664D7C
MKEIKAVIQPFMLDRVLDALHEIEGLPGVTISEARAVSLERGHYEQIVKIRLEMMVSDHLVDRVSRTILDHAHTGNPGDGGIFILPVEKAISIRTGDTA